MLLRIYHKYELERVLTHGCWIVLVKLPKNTHEKETSFLLLKVGFEFDAFYLTVVPIVSRYRLLRLECFRAQGMRQQREWHFMASS